MLRISNRNAASTWDIFQPAAPATNKRLSTTTVHTAYIFHISGHKKSKQFEAISKPKFDLEISLEFLVNLCHICKFFVILSMKTFEILMLPSKAGFYNLLIQCVAKLLKFPLPFVVELIYAWQYQTYLQSFLGYTHQIRITFVTLKKIK